MDGEIEYTYTRHVRANYEPITGNWFIENKKKIAEFLYKKIRPANAGRTYDNTQ